MQNKNARTDLALESFSAQSGGNGEIQGAELNKFTLRGFDCTELKITSGSASSVLCKPQGKYYALDLGKFIHRRENSFEDAAKCLAELLGKFEAVSNSRSFLVACLGNEKITPDAVGPLTADKIIVTRHLKESCPRDFADFASVSVFRAGVLGTSGIESAKAVAAISGEIKPGCIIVVDALAAGELGRLCTTVQLCDSGIAPGSGVGNNRAQLNADTLGVPVIAVGVPTVADASTFSDDKAAKGLFVTPRNIDELVASTAKLIAYGINLALHHGLSVTDIDLLIE